MPGRFSRLHKILTTTTAKHGQRGNKMETYYEATVYERHKYGAKPIASTTKMSEEAIYLWLFGDDGDAMKRLQAMCEGELFYTQKKTTI